jgi:competence protein ComEA
MAAPAQTGHDGAMNHNESRTLVRAAGVLLVAGVVRWAVQEGGGPPPVDPGASALPALDSAVREAAADEARASTPLAPGERIDPNRADAVELRRLPGVGPAMAEALIRSRDEDGPFSAAADLTRVRGIGPATAAKLEPHLDLAFPGRAGPVASASARVDLNQATAEALDRLPGIGPALAGRIVESRRTDGPFRRADDLLRVRGIGPVLLERLRPLVQPGGG